MCSEGTRLKKISSFTCIKLNKIYHKATLYVLLLCLFLSYTVFTLHFHLWEKRVSYTHSVDKQKRWASLADRKVVSEMGKNTFAWEWTDGSVHWPACAKKRTLGSWGLEICMETYVLLLSAILFLLLLLYLLECMYSSGIIAIFVLFSSCALPTTLTVSTATVTVSCDTTT